MEQKKHFGGTVAKYAVLILYAAFVLLPLLTVAENVMYPMELRGIKPREARRRAAELIARVKALLRRYDALGSIRETHTGSRLQVGDIALDLDTKQLLVRGDAVRVTPTEYKILRMLLANPGHVFSSEEIYSRVWDREAYAVENTVMVHIRRIREKIELNPREPDYIKVVWGIGYKMEQHGT